VKLRLFSRNRKLAITQDAFETQALEFMDEYGFDPNADNLRLYGSFIQHSPESADSFDPDVMARRIRKAHANACAFYLMHPERKAPKAEAKDENQEE
jgi:hypothetical protein